MAGKDYMQTEASEEEAAAAAAEAAKHSSILLDMKLRAPAIFIAEDYYDLTRKKCLYIDFGQILINSTLVENNDNVDYKFINDPNLLQDQYTFDLSDVKICAIENLQDYKKLDEALKTNIFSDFNLTIDFLYSIEPLHPVLPSYEAKIDLRSCRIQISDYIVHFMHRIQTVIGQK